MWRMFSVLIILIGAVNYPVHTVAQTQQPPAPPDYWFGPWFMWNGGWSFWWICPLMMVVMMLVMMFACRFMYTGHDPRDRM